MEDSFGQPATHGDPARPPQAVLNARFSCDRVLEVVLVFLLAGSVLGLGATLGGVFHAPQVLLAAVIIAGAFAHATRAETARPRVPARWRHVLLLVLVALLFRVPAYHYVMGGQDEGLYVNIAHQIEHSGGIGIHDGLKQQLQGTQYLDQYLADNATSGGYLAGVSSRGPRNSKLEFLFYDLFPVWMATVGGVFGAQGGVYALTFFAILSIVLFYRLALILTESYHAALLAGALLALNPLHAFFSKFPVTEVPALCFALAGFVLLARYRSAPAEVRRGRWLVMSALAFLCLFTTRISGFMYMPFLVGLVCATLLLDLDAVRRRAIARWGVCVVIAYALSVAYGLTWSHAYSESIYRASFEPLLGASWKAGVGGIIVGALAACAAIASASRREAVRAAARSHIVGPLIWLPVCVALVSLGIGLFKIHRLGWTAKYALDPGLGVQWQLANAAWVAASASSLWTLVVFLGPLVVALFFVLLFRRISNPPLAFLRWLAVGFLGFALVLQWVIPYSPYYARYMLSEVAPYVLLAVVCGWWSLRPGAARILVRAALVATACYSAVLSAAQIGKSENDGAYRALAQLVRHTDAHDLILLQPSAGADPSAIKTPLIYTFHRTVATVSAASVFDFDYIAQLDAAYDDVFLITPERVTSNAFSLVDAVRFQTLQFQWNHSFPHRLVVGDDVLLNMYRMKRSHLAGKLPVAFAKGQQGSRWLVSGWNAPEAWGVWSSGTSASLAISPSSLPVSEGMLVLDLDANVLVSSSHPSQRVFVSVGGRCVAAYEARYPEETLTMRVPLGTARVTRQAPISVAFSLPDAASPVALGMSRDSRVLALGLVSARFVTLPPDAAAPRAATCGR